MDLKRYIQNDTRDRLEAAYTLRRTEDDEDKERVRMERKRMLIRLWMMKNRERRNAYMREYNRQWYAEHKEEISRRRRKRRAERKLVISD